MNPYPELLEQHNTKEIIKNRIEKFSKLLGLEKQRLADCTFVQAVLSACWAAQDNNQEVLNYFNELIAQVFH